MIFMDLSVKTCERDNILNGLLQHMPLFRSFEHAYLFGSVLCENKYPGDMDLLLVYSEYSDGILSDTEHIQSFFEETFHLPVDFR